MSKTFNWCIDKTRLKTFDKQVLGIDVYGSKCWYFNGELHRVNGPALEYAGGTKRWYLYGEPHRVNGPAIECADGEKLWYLNGKYYTKSEYWKELNK